MNHRFHRFHGLFDLGQRFDGFQFYDNLTVYKEVRPELPRDDAFVRYVEAGLAVVGDAAYVELMRQCFLVDRFQTCPERLS